MAGGFRANIFDPLLIVAQIVAMQCSFYAFMGLWILLADVIGGIQPSVEQVLDYRVSVHPSVPKSTVVFDNKSEA